MSKSKKKRTNPRRQPVTMADVSRAKFEAVEQAISATQALVFTVLLDKRGFDKPALQETWADVQKLTDEVIEGRVSLADLMCVLREEYDVRV